MLTWAMVWMLKSGAASIPGGLMLLAMAGDVLMVFFIACAVRGWPGAASNKEEAKP